MDKVEKPDLKAKAAAVFKEWPKVQKLYADEKTGNMYFAAKKGRVLITRTEIEVKQKSNQNPSK